MKNFTLSLYAFHLCQSFTNALDEVDENASLLWENLAQLGATALPFHKLKDLRSASLAVGNRTSFAITTIPTIQPKKQENHLSS